MTQRTIFSLTAIVLLAMAILLALNLPQLLTGTLSEPFVKTTQVKHINVITEGKSRTLNFEQQKAMIEYINRSAKVEGIRAIGTKTEPDFEKMAIFLINKPSIEITPIVYVDKNLIYSAPIWNPQGYMMDLSDGEMQNLIHEVIQK